MIFNIRIENNAMAGDFAMAYEASLMLDSEDEAIEQGAEFYKFVIALQAGINKASAEIDAAGDAA